MVFRHLCGRYSALSAFLVLTSSLCIAFDARGETRPISALAAIESSAPPPPSASLPTASIDRCAADVASMLSLNPSFRSDAAQLRAIVLDQCGVTNLPVVEDALIIPEYSLINAEPLADPPVKCDPDALNKQIKALTKALDILTQQIKGLNDDLKGLNDDLIKLNKTNQTIDDGIKAAVADMDAAKKKGNVKAWNKAALEWVDWQAQKAAIVAKITTTRSEITAKGDEIADKQLEKDNTALDLQLAQFKLKKCTPAKK